MPGGLGKYLINTIMSMMAGRALGVVREEIDQAKQEVQEKAANLGKGILLLTVAATFLFFTVSVLLAAAVLGLATVWPAWLAALAVGGALLIISLIVFAAGSSKVKKNKDLRPDRAITNLRRYFSK